MSDSTNTTAGYWKKNPEAPFYELLSTVNSYCHPEVEDVEELAEIIKHPETGEWRIRFKEEHRAALLDPSQIPHPKALFEAAKYDDGDARSFLRRLWRDLYPGEPVPGGDDEFREDLRMLIHGEVGRVPFAVSYYDDRPALSSTNDAEELKSLGQRIWRRIYPDEPLP
jgi:hypothetical protein